MSLYGFYEYILYKSIYIIYYLHIVILILYDDLISQVTVLEINISVLTLSRLTGCVVCCGVMATYSIIIQLLIVYDITLLSLFIVEFNKTSSIDYE